VPPQRDAANGGQEHMGGDSGQQHDSRRPGRSDGTASGGQDLRGRSTAIARPCTVQATRAGSGQRGGKGQQRCASHTADSWRPEADPASTVAHVRACVCVTPSGKAGDRTRARARPKMCHARFLKRSKNPISMLQKLNHLCHS